MATREEVISWMEEALDTEEGIEDTLRDVLDWILTQGGKTVKYSIGDKIIVKTSRSGAPIGQELEITTVNGQNGTVRNCAGAQWTVYLSGSNQDIIVFADRKKQSEAIKEQIAETEKIIARLKTDYDILVNFESEEQYTAFKISQILKNKDNPKAIEELLKTLKTTNYL